VRTTFEITAPGLGSQNAVCGAGATMGWWSSWRAADTGIGFAIGETA